MKRLIKLNESEFTYKFESPITVNIGDETSWSAYSYMLTEDAEFSDIIQQSIQSEMAELSPEGLANPNDKGVTSIIVTVQDNKAITIVKSNKELSDADLEDLKEYIIAEFSDGWGEGFEQSMLKEWEEEGSEYSMSVSMYNNSSNWYIKLV